MRLRSCSGRQAGSQGAASDRPRGPASSRQARARAAGSWQQQLSSGGSTSAAPCKGYLCLRGPRTLAGMVLHVHRPRPGCRPTTQAARNVQLCSMAPSGRAGRPNKPRVPSEPTWGRVVGRPRGWGPWRRASPPCSTLPRRALEDCIFPATPRPGMFGGAGCALRQECLSHATAPATTTTPWRAGSCDPEGECQDSPISSCISPVLCRSRLPWAATPSSAWNHAFLVFTALAQPGTVI